MQIFFHYIVSSKRKKSDFESDSSLHSEWRGEEGYPTIV